MLSVSPLSLEYQQNFNVTTKMRNKQVYEVKSHLTSLKIQRIETSARIETQVDLLNEKYGPDCRIGFTMFTEEHTSLTTKPTFRFSYWVTSPDRHTTYKIWNEVQNIVKKN